MEKALQFLSALLEKLVNHPDFASVGRKSDQQFLQFHLKQAKSPVVKDVYAYISTLDNSVIKRLHRASSSIPEGPMCQRIASCTQEVMKSRSRMEALKYAGKTLAQILGLFALIHAGKSVIKRHYFKD